MTIGGRMMNTIDKKAIKSAVTIAAIVLVVFEALSIFVHLIDPEGGILRVNYRNPLQHVIIVVIALGFGICAYIKERKKKNNN
jgi:hypothetical protein